MTTIREELVWLEGFIAERIHGAAEGGSARARGRRFGFEVVLCHNDLLSGNILLSKSYQNQLQLKLQQPHISAGAAVSGRNSDGSGSDRRVSLIDYEYAAYTFRAFDIANHFSGRYLVCATLRAIICIITCTFILCGATEHCGFEYDLQANFPSEEFMLAFLREYVRGSHAAEDKQEDKQEEEEEEFLRGLLVS